jgi:hypothetical protein
MASVIEFFALLSIRVYPYMSQYRRFYLNKGNGQYRGECSALNGNIRPLKLGEGENKFSPRIFYWNYLLVSIYTLSSGTECGFSTARS